MKKMFIVLAVLILSIGFMGCSSPTDPDNGGGGNVTIDSVLHGTWYCDNADGAWGESYGPVTVEINASTIVLNFEKPLSETYGSVTRREYSGFTSGDGPDQYGTYSYHIDRGWLDHDTPAYDDFSISIYGTFIYTMDQIRMIGGTFVAK